MNTYILYMYIPNQRTYFNNFRQRIMLMPGRRIVFIFSRVYGKHGYSRFNKIILMIFAFNKWLFNKKIKDSPACNFCNHIDDTGHFYGPITRYGKLGVAHAPGMPGMFSPPSTSKETVIQRSKHASRHVRQARAVMHVGIANPR